MFKEEIINTIKRVTKLSKEEAASLIEIPPNPEFGDYAFPCFILAKKYKKNPNEIALELTEKIEPNFLIERVVSKGPYLNFFINKGELAKQTIRKILKEKDKYGSSSKGKNKSIAIDMSSPNIAKPFSIGHLRSTIIGNSISKIYNFLSYKTIKINYLGDWGTQFGKLITTYKKWGKESELKKDPINHLLNLYVRFHNTAYKKPKLEEEARLWFKKLENNDKEALKLWKLFTKISLKEFKEIYKLLNVSFDVYSAESHYNKDIENTIKLIKSKTRTEVSEGALIIPLEEHGMPPCIIKKKDDTTLYSTREIAAAIHRYKQYKPFKLLYIVGFEQNLHFKQIFKIIELIGFKWYKNLIHVNFGHYRFDKKKISTRKGDIIFMEDVLQQSINLAKQIIKKKNPKLKNKEKIAKAIGVGAVIFNDLSQDRIKDIDFDWNKILSFEGETGPYIQYSHARICSILRKTKRPSKANYYLLKEPIEIELIKQLSNFPDIIENSALSYKPSLIANYLIDLAQNFNTFYSSLPVLKAPTEIKKARIHLIIAVKQVLKTSLNLLGIEALERM